MKNGFYVSAYCAIDELGYVRTAQIRHDQAIALWKVKDNCVDLIKYWELERITRQKQHMRPFYNKAHFNLFLEKLLNEVNLGLDDIIDIWGMPNFGTEDSLIRTFTNPKVPLHSLAHVFSSLVDTQKQFSSRNIFFAFDGGPDNLLDHGFDKPYHYASLVMNKGVVEGIEHISSPAYAWAEASERFRMREGTLMALAEACKCQLPLKIGINVKDFYSMWDIPKLRKECDRIWNLILSTDLELDDRFSIDENRISCFMKIVQAYSKELVDRQIDFILSKYHVDPQKTIISISGGYALNCPTNTHVMKKYKFKEFISSPCVNDSGIALGIGLAVMYAEYGASMKFNLSDAYYGHSEKGEHWKDKYKTYIESIQNYNIDQFISDIEDSPICWFESGCEIGPRALGHRSILSIATSMDMKNRINTLKQREWWRPVAPIMLGKVVEDWCTPSIISPYMLHAVEILEDKQKLVPAILHLNNTARIQTIDENNSFYSILDEYYKKTGIPMLCNTSMNDKGEPIINTYDELFNFALRKKIKVIYIERKRVVLKNFETYLAQEPYINNIFDECLGNKVIDKFSDLEIDDEILDFYVNHRYLLNGVSIDNENLEEIVEGVRNRIYENISGGSI